VPNPLAVRRVSGCLSWASLACISFCNLLVGGEDFESRDEVGKGHRLVALPLLVSLNVVDEDDIVVLSALVVDDGLVGVALNHCGGVCGEYG